MNLSLKNRIAFGFIAAVAVIIFQGAFVFYFLNQMSQSMQQITYRFNQENSLTDELRGEINKVFREQRSLVYGKGRWEKSNDYNLGDASKLVDSLLTKIDRFYSREQMRKAVSTLSTINQQYMDIIDRMNQQGGRFDAIVIESLADNMEKSYEVLSELQFSQARAREDRLDLLVADTKRQMLISLIITFLGTILLSLIIPAKIALPFRKIKAAIRELRDCNYDVSIQYEGKDEIGEIAHELNKLITSLKDFEALRVDRIEVEMKKFETLANMLKKHVLVTNSDGELIYLNHSLYSLLNVSSEDVLGRDIQDTLVPDSIKEAYHIALKRRTKVENSEVALERRDDNNNLLDHFSGYATVIPIRGRDSTQDYYLMVLSKEIFD